MLMCQHALCAYMLTCQRALHAYMLTCLACLHAHMPTCLACLCAYGPTFFAYLCAQMQSAYVLMSSFHLSLFVSQLIQAMPWESQKFYFIVRFCQYLLFFFLLYLDIRETLSGSNMVESSFIKQLILRKNIYENNIVFIVKLQIACINQALHN